MNKRQQKAIEKLYYDYQEFLVIYAENTVKSRSLAEEAVQETFRIACMKPDAPFTGGDPRCWLICTLRYVMANMLRHQASAQKLLADCLGEQLLGGGMDTDKFFMSWRRRPKEKETAAPTPKRPSGSPMKFSKSIICPGTALHVIPARLAFFRNRCYNVKRKLWSEERNYNGKDKSGSHLTGE